MYMIMEHRLLNRNIKFKIRVRSNPATTRYSFWDLSIKFNVTCTCFLISKHGSKIVITNETFHSYFLLLTLPTGALNKIFKKILRWNAIFVSNVMKDQKNLMTHIMTMQKISFCKMVDFMEKHWIAIVSVA